MISGTVAKAVVGSVLAKRGDYILTRLEMNRITFFCCEPNENRRRILTEFFVYSVWLINIQHSTLYLLPIWYNTLSDFCVHWNINWYFHCFRSLPFHKRDKWKVNISSHQNNRNKVYNFMTRRSKSGFSKPFENDIRKPI